MRLSPTALVFAATAASRLALGAPPAAEADPIPPPEPAAAVAAAGSPADPLAALRGPPGFTYHFVGSLFFGEGFRFNNPYRLHSQLGESARSVSLTAPYIDLGLGIAVGSAFGLQHGAALRISAALSGVDQAALAPTYFASYRGASERIQGFGRLGPVFLLSPDANAGAEIGAGAAVFLTARTAVSLEIVGDLFYGAATHETGFPVYPVLSFQLGLLFDHEVLP
jgi:hypothetical protein